MKALKFLWCTLAILSESAVAGFQDQGFVNAVVRTDYNSQTEGQSSNPITFVNPCLFSVAYCGNSPTIYSATHSFAQNTAGYPQSNFWVLNFNNELAFDYRCPLNPVPPLVCTPGAIVGTTSNPGPPNQSLPRAAPGFGLMGFTAITASLPGETFYRAHMVVNGTFPNPQFGGTPFLSVGGEKDRGNAGVSPGQMFSASGQKRVQFKARMWDFKLPTQVGNQPPTIVFYMIARATWGGKSRGIQLALAHWNWDNSDSIDFSKQYKWNWPMQESYYYPGVEWAFIDAEDVAVHCGFSVPRLTTKNQQYSYDVNLQSLFQCLSNAGGWDTPIPTTSPLSITGVHWAAEMTGVNGWLWPSVHDMKMVQ